MAEVADAVETVRAAGPRGAAIVFQGVPGAYSHMACRQACPRPRRAALPLVRGRVRGRARGPGRRAMIPVDNSVAGRVADVHHLLPRCRPAHRRRALPAGEPPPPGAAGRPLEDVKTVHSPRSRAGPVPRLLRELGLAPRSTPTPPVPPPTSPRPGDPTRPRSPRGSRPRSTAWRS